MNMKNYVSIKGKLGAKPERTEKNGRVYTRFSVGVNNYKKNQETGEYEQTDTDWISVVAFSSINKLAERVATLEKGDSVHVQGKLSRSKYDKEGVTIFSQNLVAEEVTRFTPLLSEKLSKISNRLEQEAETSNVL